MAKTPHYKVVVPHNWVLGSSLGFGKESNMHTIQICKECGVIRPRISNPDSSCKGKIKVTHREVPNG